MLTPKEHWLIKHVVQFARRHAFWAMGSEQSVEHLHALMNTDFRRFAAIRNEEELFWQVARLQIIRNRFFDFPKLNTQKKKEIG